MIHRRGTGVVRGVPRKWVRLCAAERTPAASRLSLPWCGSRGGGDQAPGQGGACVLGVNAALHAVAAFWAAAKTSRADVVPATCSVPSTPRPIHPAFTASNISSAGLLQQPFGGSPKSNPIQPAADLGSYNRRAAGSILGVSFVHLSGYTPSPCSIRECAPQCRGDRECLARRTDPLRKSRPRRIARSHEPTFDIR